MRKPVESEGQPSPILSERFAPPQSTLGKNVPAGRPAVRLLTARS